ncbi:MAG TPA: thioesterase, partial [Pseudomonas sp.]|nr:thioesterase [Pseudomonas sp.]
HAVGTFMRMGKAAQGPFGKGGAA